MHVRVTLEELEEVEKRKPNRVPPRVIRRRHALHEGRDPRIARISNAVVPPTELVEPEALGHAQGPRLEPPPDDRNRRGVRRLEVDLPREFDRTFRGWRM
jgi:hypothetical protein